MNSSALRAAALDYASRDWRVLPLRAGGKEPHGRLVRRGHLDATTDPAKIRSWWDSEPDANVGILCGPSSFDVLDVDPPDGLFSLRRLVALHGRMTTRMHRTPRGGLHLLFLPTGLRCSESALGKGLDTKGGGKGYIVAPPSFVDGRPYSVAVLAEIAAPPEWLVEWNVRRGPRWSGGTLDESVALVRDAPEGERNSTLNRELFVRLKEITTAGEAEGVVTILTAASALEDKEEIGKVTRSALKAGLEAARRYARRFRRVPAMTTRDPRFRGRSAKAKLLELLLCTGEGATAIPGVAVISPRSLAEEASLTAAETRDGLRELSKRGLLRSDLRAGVFWLPSVTGVFRPERANEKRAWLNALEFGIPRCSLRREIALEISGHFGALSSTLSKRALKEDVHKEEGSPLLLAPGSESSENTNALNAERNGVTGGDA